MENNKDKRGEELTYELGKVMGFYNWKGRIIEVTPKGYIMSGMIFPTYKELEEAYNQSLKYLGQNIK
jgi:hypothetical protein